jgi:hypothetical protein
VANTRPKSSRASSTDKSRTGDKAELSQGKSKLLRQSIERNGEDTHLVRRNADLE